MLPVLPPSWGPLLFPGGQAFPIPLLVSFGSWYIRIPSYCEGHAGQLEAVGAVKHAHAEAARDLVQRVEEHRLPFPIHVEALLDELIVGEDVLTYFRGLLTESDRAAGILAFAFIESQISDIFGQHLAKRSPGEVES